jgi:hypothetical protein
VDVSKTNLEYARKEEIWEDPCRRFFSRQQPRFADEDEFSAAFEASPEFAATLAETGEGFFAEHYLRSFFESELRVRAQKAHRREQLKSDLLETEGAAIADADPSLTRDGSDSMRICCRSAERAAKTIVARWKPGAVRQLIEVLQDHLRTEGQSQP